MTTVQRIIAAAAQRGLTADQINVAQAARFVDDVEAHYGGIFMEGPDWDQLMNDYSTSGLVLI